MPPTSEPVEPSELDTFRAGFAEGLAFGRSADQLPPDPERRGVFETVCLVTGFLVVTVLGVRLAVFAVGLIANDGPAPK